MSDTKKNIAATTEKIERESKLKKEISNCKQSIEKTYNEMGKAIFEHDGKITDIKDLIKEKIEYIKELNKKIEESNIELLRSKKKKICPNCLAEIDLYAAFCPECGKEQEKVEVEPEVEVLPKGKVKCIKCNQIIDDNIAFCPECGEEQKKTEISVDEEKKVEEGKE